MNKQTSSLSESLSDLKNIGPAAMQDFAVLGITSVKQLAFNFIIWDEDQ